VLKSNFIAFSNTARRSKNWAMARNINMSKVYIFNFKYFSDGVILTKCTGKYFMALFVERTSNRIFTSYTFYTNFYLKMGGGVPPLPHLVFMDRCLIKHRDKFTFTEFVYFLIV